MLLVENPDALETRAAELDRRADGIDCGGTATLDACKLRTEASQLRQRAAKLRQRRAEGVRFG